MSAVLQHIELVLAREPGHPQGDRNHAYHLRLPLTADGRIVAEAWRKHRALCNVRRVRPNEHDAHGLIVHGPGGRWIFDYTDATDRDDEVGFRLSEERFVPGEYISVREDDGKTHVFQVAAIHPV